MRTPIVLLIALVAMTSTRLEGQEWDAARFDESETVADLALDEELVVEFDQEEPLEEGPGFRSFGRFLLGGFSITKKDSYTGLLGVVSDYGDLTSYSMRFNTIGVEEIRSIFSIEFVGQHAWDGSWNALNSWPAWRMRLEGYGLGIEAGHLPMAERAPLQVKNDAHALFKGYSHANYLGYGIRFNRNDDDFRFDGLTDVVGRVYSFTDVDQYVIGPQLTVGHVAAKGRWSFDLSGSLLLGYGRTDEKQNNGWGDDAVPGGHNNLLYMEPAYSRYNSREERFAAYSELRLVTSYHFKRNWSLDAVARAFVATPWHRADQIVEYHMPDFGMGESESNTLTGGNLSIGLTYLR